LGAGGGGAKFLPLKTYIHKKFLFGLVEYSQMWVDALRHFPTLGSY